MAISWRVGVLVSLSILVALFVPTWWAVTSWLVMCAAIAVIDAVSAVSPRSLTIRRTVHSPIRTNQKTTATISISNPHRRGIALDVRDAWPPSAQQNPSHQHIRLGGGETTTIETTLIPSRRGTVHSDLITIRLWGPLRFAARQVSISAPCSLQVLPEFKARRLLPSRIARLHEQEGTSQVILRGPGTEFDSLRDYVIGDDPRDIDWRASARARNLIVRTWRPERDRHVVLVIDTGRSAALLLTNPDDDTADNDARSHTSYTKQKKPAGNSSSSQQAVVAATTDTSPNVPTSHSHQQRDSDRIDISSCPRLDIEIETALLMAALADNAGDKVHLLAMDRDVRCRLSGVSGGPLMSEIASALGNINAIPQATDWIRLVQEIRRTVLHPSLIVIATEVPPLGSDSDFIEAISLLLQRHTVVIASPRDPQLNELRVHQEDIDSIYASAAAISSIDALAANCAQVSRMGAVVVEDDAQFLPAKVADTYLELKRSGQL